MSLALIQESAKEVRRLAIAGSALAVGDFRLKKLAAPLEQAGAKVPVFGQVAKAINDLVNGKEAESAASLLHLSTLLNAILYTQGQTGAEGACCAVDSFPTSCYSTRTGARLLKPLIEALTTKGAERFKEVKAAVERGAFNDLRLVQPAIQALDDNYAELADLIAEKVLPTYGPGIVPLLKQKLDLKGKKGDARRLSVLHQLDPAGALELCKTALDDGSPEVKTAAIACLGKHEECLPLLLEQVKAKNKVVRAAALEALANYDRPDVTSLFAELLKAKSLDILAGPFRSMRSKHVINSLLEEGRRVFDSVAKSDSESSPRFNEILDCLTSRKEPESAQFILDCLSQCEKLAKLKAPKNSTLTGLDLMSRLAALGYGTGLPSAREAILARHNVLPPAAFIYVLRCALLTMPAAKMYDEFAPLLQQKKGAGKAKANQLQYALLAAARPELAIEDLDVLDAEIEPDEALGKVELDPRWLDAAIEANELQVVCALARPDHKEALTFLTKTAEAPKHSYQIGSIMEALARCQYPSLTDLFLKLVTSKAKKSGTNTYELHWLFETARHLPASDLPRLDAFAATLDEKLVDRFLEALGPLRAIKSEQTSPA
jgi:HEAT repeat protein